MRPGFTDARLRQPNEFGPFLQQFYSLCAGVRHAGAKASDELVQDILGSAAVGHHRLYSFGDDLASLIKIQFRATLDVITIDIGSIRSHSAYDFVSLSVTDDRRAWCLVRSSQHAADHDRACRGSEGFHKNLPKSVSHHPR